MNRRKREINDRMKRRQASEFAWALAYLNSGQFQRDMEYTMDALRDVIQGVIASVNRSRAMLAERAIEDELLREELRECGLLEWVLPGYDKAEGKL